MNPKRSKTIPGRQSDRSGFGEQIRFAGLVLVFVFWSGTVTGGQLGAEFNAFNGYTLETPISGYPSLRLIRRNSTEFVQDVTLYELPGEQLKLAGVLFNQVQYRFADGLLESVQLTYEGRENRDRLLSWIEGHYGNLPANERRIVAQVVWHGEKMVIMLNYNWTYNQGVLWFVSPDLHKEINRTTASIPD
jgi:hypothetical protein